MLSIQGLVRGAWCLALCLVQTSKSWFWLPWLRVFSARCPARGACWLVTSAQGAVPSARCAVVGAAEYMLVLASVSESFQCLVLTARSLVSSARCLVPHVWCAVVGVWCAVLGDPVE